MTPPGTLVRRARRGGLLMTEIARRTGIHASVLRKLLEGDDCGALSEDALVRLARVADEPARRLARKRRAGPPSR